MTRGRGWHLQDHEPERLESVAQRIEDTAEFWRYVDSQSTYTAREGSGCCEDKLTIWGHRTDCHIWSHVRSHGCVAANSNLGQCGQWPLAGLPFCDFHFDRAWLAILAIVTRERSDNEVRLRKFRHEYTLRNADVEIAQVYDARKLLEAQPERVYFFAADHAVKIGRSINPEQRVKTLGGTLAPDDVNVRTGQLLGTIPGGSHVERALHQQFRPYRLVGEWFALAPIQDEIDALLRTTTDEGNPRPLSVA